MKIKFLLFIVFVISCNELNAQLLTKNSQESELNKRIQLVTDRLVFGKEPSITEDFVLACVTLDPQYKRRFTEFSGDQSGRYLSVFSKLNIDGNPINIHQLVKKIIATQKSDGRFGSDTLVFNTTSLKDPQMALLWGNGRLFTGLMDYYESYKDPEVLKSAIRLADFLMSITETIIKPEVISELKEKGATGFICFTQNIEGLVKLYNATKNQKYIQLAEKIYPLLTDKGTQHSHGYLNTLRGVLMLYTATQQKEQLDFVTTRYNQVVESTDMLVTGGVPEFFGGGSSADGYRDEGCSEADWVMLSLELWQSTGENKYLDKAEFCLMNELMLNQFDSGDFGHHHIEKDFGYKLSFCEGRSWWCCDYHCLQAMMQFKNLIVTNLDGAKKINFFYPTEFKDKDISFNFSKVGKLNTNFKIKIDKTHKKENTISIRKPYWAKSMSLKSNGIPFEAKEQDGYLSINKIWKEGDEIEVNLDYDIRFITRQKQTISLDKAKANINEIAFQFGPYLMSVDDGFMPLFLAEPATKNVIIVDRSGFKSTLNNRNSKSVENTFLPEAYCKFKYIHEGFYGENNVTMRPASEISNQKLANLKLWFNFRIE